MPAAERERVRLLGIGSVSWDEDGEEEACMSWAAVCCDGLWLWRLWENARLYLNFKQVQTMADFEPSLNDQHDVIDVSIIVKR